MSASRRPSDRGPDTADVDGVHGAGIVISCEHGGNRIPARYREWFTRYRALLASHRGFDPGALSMARALAAAFGAPLVASTVSRLLVDLNRSTGHPRLHAETLRRAPAGVREAILTRYYRPYRARAEALVALAIAARGRALHLSVHSFTPELDGKVRRVDIGLLYDPARPGEAALCRRWQAELASRLPGLSIRRNAPYEGKGDGLTRWFRRHLPPGTYVGIEIEINQKHVLKGGRHWAAIRDALVESLRNVLATPTGECVDEDSHRL